MEEGGVEMKDVSLEDEEAEITPSSSTLSATNSNQPFAKRHRGKKGRKIMEEVATVSLLGSPR